MFSMSHLGTHTLCGKVSLQAVSFTANAMGATWSQRSDITLPVVGYNKPESIGAGFQEDVVGD